MSRAQPAILVLADGSVFRGLSIGADGITTGEVVFNTALTGYQEILTDPSYSRQIVTLTYPHIGNTGINPEDVEADRIHAAGLVVRDVPRLHSNFRASQSLSDYLLSELRHLAEQPTIEEFFERLRHREPVRLCESSTAIIRRQRGPL